MNAPVSAFVLDAAVLRRAREDAARDSRSALELLEERSGLPPREFVGQLGQLLHYRTLSNAQLAALAPDYGVLPFPEAARHGVIAARDGAGELLVVCADPLDAERIEWAEARIRSAFSWVLAHRDDLAVYLVRQEDALRAIDGALAPAAQARAAAALEDLSFASISEDTNPTVRLVNSTLYDALKTGASDIHLESRADGLEIKYRIDGVLSPVGVVGGREQAQQMVSRVKVMSELDIAETRVPQDGRLKIATRGREVDLRVSIMPSIFGEDAVLRILDKQALADRVAGLTLAQLGFDETTMRGLRRLSREPYGMLLVTGPTGSGKTTTLYAAISEINHGRDKIVTIEDPVEYQLAGVLQIPVNEKKGLTFARGLRSILRHDPDKIMVGEIRDPETAQIGVQAALTGHLVLTTVHANNVFDVIGRFTHMQVDPYNLVSALNGVLAQRLVRLNCPECSEAAPPTAEQLADSALERESVAGYRWRAGRGCGVCRGTGYKGRKAVGELLRLTPEIAELIVSRAPLRTLRAAAEQSGTRFLRQAALALVRSGETTLDEVNRVTAVA
ncbi:MAG: GspE/PulE family protein [Betaproteobacteria bacterium]|nr:GspE/PulE family protein [Betaproteobacteria bacterium]MDH4324366.1 GspE/PulE family protein [Betaproteobacteria bacterium]